MPNIPKINIGGVTYDVKDTVARDHLVEVSETQPTSDYNRVWVKPAEGEYTVPTMDDHNELKSAVNNELGYISPTWIYGYIESNGTIHENVTSKTTILSDAIVFEKGDIINVINTSSTNIYFSRFDENMNFISQTRITTGSLVVDQDCFARIAYSKPDYGNIPDPAVGNEKFQFIRTYYRKDILEIKNDIVNANNELLSISSNVSLLKEKELGITVPVWIYGYIESNGTVHENVTSKTTILSPSIPYNKGDEITINSVSTNVYFSRFDKNGRFIGQTRITTGSLIVDQDCFGRIAFSKQDYGNISDLSVGNTLVSVERTYYRSDIVKAKTSVAEEDLKENVNGTGIANIISNQIKKDRAYKSEDYRPLFHMTPEKNWLNDPHGFVYYKGKYHVYYQYNQNVLSNNSGYMKWGHFVSDDLITWQEHGLAMNRNDGGCWDGTCVIDSNNMLGFGADTLLAFYTFKPSGGQQLCLAYSTDDGETFQQYEGNPIISWEDSGQTHVFRDPKIAYDEEHEKYVMVIALDTGVGFYSSTDLIRWTYLSTYTVNADPTECPRFFKIGADWVLLYSRNWNGQRYVIGSWDGNQFTSVSGVKVLCYGESYAIETSNYTGKTYGVMWFSPNKYVNSVISDNYALPSNGILSTIVEFSIDDGALCMNPIVRTNANKTNISGSLCNETLIGYGNAVQIKIHADITTMNSARLMLKFNADGDEYDSVSFNGSNGKIIFNREHEMYAEQAAYTFDTSCTIDTTGMEEIDLNVIVDVGCTEIYACGGKYSIFGHTFNGKTINKKILLSFSGMDVDSVEVNPIVSAVPHKYIS